MGRSCRSPDTTPRRAAGTTPAASSFLRSRSGPRRGRQRALAKLRAAIQTLPFEQEVDFSVALALMLCALVRRSLPAAPLGAISATAPSSGKSLLADCISILAVGSAAPR
jgi:hypothetical protein